MCLCIPKFVTKTHAWSFMYKELKPSAAVNIYEGLGVKDFKWFGRVYKLHDHIGYLSQSVDSIFKERQL